jgi:hypothetical protein
MVNEILRILNKQNVLMGLLLKFVEYFVDFVSISKHEINNSSLVCVSNLKSILYWV